MKGSFISFGIAGMFLMAACSTSNYTQKTSADDLYSPNASAAPAIHHSQTNSQSNTSPSDQVIDPPVIVDRSTDNADNNSDGSYDTNGGYDNNGNNGYDNNGYNGYQGYNSYNGNGSSWDNSAMNRMGYASSSFGYYGPAYSGFTMYSPLYYSPGFSMSLGFSFGTSMFYSPMWNSYAWMPMPPPPPVYYAPMYPYYPYAFGMYNPYCMNPYAFMDPYGYYGGYNSYYGGYYPSTYNNNYYGPRGSTGSNTSSNGSAKVYGPGRSSNPIPTVNNNNNSSNTIRNSVVPSVHNAYPVDGNNGQQMQSVRRPNAVAPAEPRMVAPNQNSGHPKNEFRPMPQAFETEQPQVIYRNNQNHEMRPQSTERFHQTLNEEGRSRNFEQHPVQNTQHTSSSNSNSPHTNGNRQYR